MLITVSSLFNEQYLVQLYSGKQAKLEIIKGYLNRFFVLFTLWKYDRVVIEYELFPYLPAWAEVLMSKLGVSYIVDYDDAVFHNYDLSQNKWIKRCLSDKIDKVMRFSKTTVVGNEYIANYARLAGAKDVQVIPTVIDLERYIVKGRELVHKETVIGWIGTKSTFKYVRPLKRVFEAISKKYQIKINLIGVDDNMGLPELVEPIKWAEDTEVEEIRKFDIGIMPLADTPWEKGKCAYKLIQYMACGLPVIASPIGMNTKVVNSNGMLVENFNDWQLALEIYIVNEVLRIEHGKLGRMIVESAYCLQETQAKLLQIIKS